jgi:hypothetical protein
LAAFSRAVFGVPQKYASAAFNRRVYFFKRASTSFAATFFAPTMIAVCRLRMLKIQVKRLAGLALKASLHVSISIV